MLLIPGSDIHREQVNLLYRALPFSLLAVVINAGILSVIQWSVIDQRIITAWLSAIILVSLYRGFTYLRFHKSGISTPAVRENFFMSGTLISSVIWGAGSYLLFPENNIAHQAFLAFVMAGMCAGAITNLSFIRKYIFIFLTFLLVPLIIRFANDASELSAAMAFMIGLFYVLVSISGQRIYESTLQNITMRLEAVERERLLDSYHQKQQFHVQRTPLGYIEWDKAFNVVRWNPSAEKIFGFSQSQALGKNAFDLIIPESEREHVANIWQELCEHKGGMRSSNKNKTRTGDIIYCEWHNTPLLNEGDEIVGVASLVEDITARKDAEINIIKAKETAELASQAKSQFLSRMSHELRTPLNAIHGFSQLLEGNTENLEPEQKECISHVLKASNHLLHLVDEVLDIVSVENNELKFNIQDLPVKALISNCIRLVTMLAEKNHVIIDRLIDEEVWVRADEPRLQQVIINLLRNAIIYNKPGGHVTISFSISLDQRIRVSITDTGLGIRDKDQVVLFEPFPRTIITDKSIEGKGLGLSISKKLVEAMDGLIGVDSSYNIGSTFWIELPRGRPLD